MMWIQCLLFISFYAVQGFIPIDSSSLNSKSKTQLQMSTNEIHVMVNGMPGLMALETAKSCLDNGVNLIPVGFTGEGTANTNIFVQGREKSVTVDLLAGPGMHMYTPNIKYYYYLYFIQTYRFKGQ